MRRELPPRPHLEHLKKQAKELLESHSQGDPEARERVRTTLPARLEAPLALHDAQSVIAREYGFASWRALRAELEQRSAQRAFSAIIAEYTQRPLPPEASDALKASFVAPRSAATLGGLPLPPRAPVLPLRDFIVPPGSIAPVHVARPFSLRAVDASGTESPSILAVFTQRDPRVETVTAADLHEVGSLVELRSRIAQHGGLLVILEGIRWIALQELEDTGEYLRASIIAARREPVDDDTDAVNSIATAIRTRARTLAGLIFPAPGPVIELIDSIENPQQLGDLIIANLQCPVADKARYAAEPDALNRLVTLRDLLDLQISAATKR